MTKTIYVVSERSFEYNDEIYHLPYDGTGENSGQARLAFSIKEKAIEMKNQNNLEWFKDLVTIDKDKYRYNNINCYTYEPIDTIFDSKLLDSLNVKCDDESLIIPDGFSDENYIKLMNGMDEIPLPWIVSEVVYEE